MSLPAAPADLTAHAQWAAGDGRMRAILAVEGIRCAACARTIERAVRRVAGVEHAQVNAATARLAVEWRGERSALRRIVAAVEAAGFRAVPLAGVQAGERHRAERRVALKRIGLAGLGMMQTMMFVYGIYAAGPQGIDADMAQYLRVVSMLVATPVLLYSGAPFFRGAWSSLVRRSLGMDVPVAAAIALAYGASVINTLRGAGEIYFDSVTMFIFFLLAGRYVEMAVRHRSLSATEALARSLPASVLRLRADGTTERVAAELVAAGDRLVVPKGGIVPVDGRILEGEALLDESLVTGESRPVVRRVPEAVLGGSLNVGEALRIVATSDLAGSTIAALIARLERGRATRPRLTLSADRAAAWFVLAVLVLAGGVAAVWSFMDPARAFPATLAVLVVTCPCALSLATPAALAAVTSRLARLGLLVTQPDAIERLARITTVVLDKTGTLTTGAVRIVCTAADGELGSRRALAIAAALERGSSHPLAAGFAPFDDPAIEVREVREVPGEGVEGRIEGVTWRLGRPAFVAAVSGAPGAAGTLADGLYLGSAAGFAASFTATDTVREDARQAVDALRALGLDVAIASGDAPEAVGAVARELGLGLAYGRLTPERKVAIVRERQSRGERVLMIGDGVNDGPVLAAADVSCAMGEGSAVAQAAADLLLLNDSLRTLAEAIAAARRTLAVMRQNLGWALAYNLSAVPLAAMGWIPPWVAAIGMSLSSLVVVLNAGRLAGAHRAAGPARGARDRAPLAVPEAA